MIGFVSLILPHTTSALTGSGHARLLSVTALTGVIFLVRVDTRTRAVLDPPGGPGERGYVPHRRTGVLGCAIPRMKKGKTSLHADGVVRHVGDSVVVDNATLTLRPGETVGLLGPNGLIRATLLGLLAGVLAPTAGVVTLDRRPLAEVGRRATARRIGPSNNTPTPRPN